jgi:outer membrane protein assembly factor BamB
MTAKSVVCFDADTGAFLWDKGHETAYDVNANTPLHSGGHLLVFSGYGNGAQLLRLNEDGTGPRRAWRQKKLDSQLGSAVLIDGYLYGSGHKKRGWHCVEWESGKVQYTSRRDLGGKGNIIYADGMAYCYGENGQVGLVKVSPEAFEVVSSFKVELGSDQHWAHLVVRDGRLYVRHGNTLMAYDIAAE